MSFTPKSVISGPQQAPKFEKPKWIQVIRDRKTDQILAEYSKHLSPMQLNERFGGSCNYWESMRQDEPSIIVRPHYSEIYEA